MASPEAAAVSGADAATRLVVTAMATWSDRVFVACSDGTVWGIGMGNEWYPIAPIPQPEASDA